jgi:hypothetical protein
MGIDVLEELAVSMFNVFCPEDGSSSFCLPNNKVSHARSS